MKKFFSLVSLFFVGYLYASIESPRYDDNKIHLGLPSWVTYSNGIEVSYDGPNSIKNAVVELPETHHIQLMGKIYKALKVYNSGKIELLQEKNYDASPYVEPFSGGVHYLSTSFVWKAYDRENEPYYDNQYQLADRYFTVVEQSFDCLGTKYKLQTLFYPDGEVQLQLWNYSDANDPVWPDWFLARFYDGNRIHHLLKKDFDKEVDLLQSNGLRPGWIAKPLTDDEAVSIEYGSDKRSLHVTVDGGGKDLGGIVAYDNSREHPVVGSFSSVEISVKNIPTEYFIPFDCWYFNEFYGLNLANYLPENQISYNGLKNIQLLRSEYSKTWDAYRAGGSSQLNKYHLPHSEEELSFIPAPAFKFQRYGTGGLLSYSFDITSIKYRLAQLPSVQFLPCKSEVSFNVYNSNDGRVEVYGLKGVYDEQRDLVSYGLFSSQEIKGKISAYPGKVIEKITATCFVNQVMTGAVSYVKDMNNVNRLIDLSFKKISNEEVEFSGNVCEKYYLRVAYSDCEKRTLSMIPGMIKTETFASPEDVSGNIKNETATIFNAFGGVVQTQKKIAPNKYLVSASYSNALNQPTRVPMNFVHRNNSSDDFEYVDMACENCIAEANAFFRGQNPIDQPDAEGFAYTEIKNYNGQNGAVAAMAGVAGRSFGSKGEGIAKEWVIPVSSEEDFMPYEDLRADYIEKYYAQNSERHYLKDFTLKISRDIQGKYTQKIFDTRGLLKSSWYYNGNKPVVSLYSYDDYGALKESKLKNDVGIKVTNEYDAQGRRIATETSDQGRGEIKYDNLGRLKYTRSAMQKAKGEFSILLYDALGRSYAAGVVSGMDKNAADNAFNHPELDVSKDNIRLSYTTIYGKPKINDFENLGIEGNLLADIINRIIGDRKDLIGAVISYDENGLMTKVVLSNYNVVGEKTHQWIIVGRKGFPAVQFEYSYNTSHEMIESTFSLWQGSSWVEKSRRTRDYENGRLKSTFENGMPIAEYDYTELGNIRQKTYFADGKEILIQNNLADVYDRITEINYKDGDGNPLYSVHLDFQDNLSGHVKSMDHAWSEIRNHDPINRRGQYEYDYNNRLISVTGDLNSTYAFDEIGRMNIKAEGDTTIGFAYTKPTFRPSGVNVNGGSPAASAEYFMYDESGNVWYDKNNKVVYKNSESGLPVKITKFSSMPSDITLEMVNADEPFENVDTVINIAYDNDGERLWYSVDDRLNGKKWTNVYLSGFGVFRSENEDTDNPTYELVKSELVAGGFRDASGKVRFPVADAQGNIRGYVTESGLESAYDYYPYGNAVELVVNDGDGNKGWQGKYFDAEHGKSYFGSRYFDPFFGMWMSPDPASQFANPYTYGGDPINFIDPNGEEALSTGAAIGVAAAVAAIIGGASAAYQCSKYRSGSCAVAIPQGAIVGAAAGAAGSYVGGLAAAAAVGAGEGSIVGGMAGGAASSATSYVGNGLFTGDLDLGEGLHATFLGAFSGAITGGVGSSLEVSGTNLGWAGRTGGELLGNVASAAFMTVVTEDWGNFGWNVLGSVGLGLASSVLTGFFDSRINSKNRYDGTDLLDAGLQEGDIIAWGFDGDDDIGGKLISGAIMLLSGEPYSHIGIVEKTKDGSLFIREANGDGNDRQVMLNPEHETNVDPDKKRNAKIAKYRNRSYKIVARNIPTREGYEFKGNVEKGYNLYKTNCASQTSTWKAGIPYRNNPGAFARAFVGNGSIYYNSVSLQRHILW